MFIETLEFTIPVDLCDLFSSLKRGPRSNLEFPASVNSYGTTQDANIQVALRSNKLTFKVDGVSSDSSMISKSECKTLKLAVFDVDRSLIPFDDGNYESNDIQEESLSFPTKRVHEHSISLPPAKSSRTSYGDTPRPRSPGHRRSHHRSSPPPSEQSQHKSFSGNSFSNTKNDSVNVKREPEDPDLIEIEPDDIEPKKEVPYMQIDYSSTEPRTHTSQSASDRLSHQPSSYSQSPASSSSSFHQSVPHVQDYAEPGSSQAVHGDQSADDFLVFQDEGGDENEADYSNDDYASDASFSKGSNSTLPCCQICQRLFSSITDLSEHFPMHNNHQCWFGDCGLSCENSSDLGNHMLTFHQNSKPVFCPACRQPYVQKDNLLNHAKSCKLFLRETKEVKKVAQCDVCGKWFASRQKRDAHVNSQHRGICYMCICGQTYAYKTGLDRHRKTTGHYTMADGYSIAVSPKVETDTSKINPTLD